MESNVKTIMLLTTYDCNLRCSYCYEPKKVHHAMTVNMCKHIISKSFENLGPEYTSVTIEFMGGEPLMQFPLIKEISEWIWQSDFEIPVLITAPTNGTLLDTEMKDWFYKNKERFELALSFDGDRLMQNMNRSNSAAKVDLDFFVETFPNVPVKMTLSPSTLPYYFQGVKFLHEKGFKSVGANLALGEKLGWGKKDLLVLRDQLNLLVPYYLSHPELKRISYMNIPIWNILNQDNQEFSCKLGKNLSCYDYDGKDYPCHLFSPITINKTLAQESRNLTNEKIDRNPNRLCAKCLLRSVCVKCYGFNFIESGDYNTPSAFHCAQFKLYFLANCKLQKRLAIRENNSKKIKMVNYIIELLTSKK